MNTIQTACLSIFCKNPFSVRAKTRLGLKNEDARELYSAFLLDTIKRPYPESVDKYLHLYPEASERFGRHFCDPGFTHLPQEGNDLGERMSNFFVWGRQQGYRRMALIGSDQPTLPPRRISRAFELLDKYPVVLGPSFDGGYYLIAMREPSPFLFDNVSWGGNKVLQETVSRLKHPFGLLEPWYDVDNPSDLQFLKTHLRALKQTDCNYLPAHTAALLIKTTKDIDG